MLSLKHVYFFQAGIGISANAFLLVLHIFKFHQVRRPKPTDITSCHLAFVHLVMLLTTVEILSSHIFKSVNFPNDFKCKVSYYVSRVTRNLSISTTCLLSIVQVIIISPNSFYLSRFKHKLTNYIIIAFFSFWSLNLSSNSSMVIYAVAYSNRTSLLNVSKYCSLSSMNSVIVTLFLTLTLSQNVFFIGIMLLSSMYMVVFLCSHHRKTEYLQSMSISPKTPRISPAKQATRTVLVLVSFFVIMYCVDSIISSFSSILRKYEPVVVDIQRLVGNVYATVSPLVLISSDKRLIGILQNVIGMKTMLN